MWSNISFLNIFTPFQKVDPQMLCRVMDQSHLDASHGEEFIWAEYRNMTNQHIVIAWEYGDIVISGMKIWTFRAKLNWLVSCRKCNCTWQYLNEIHLDRPRKALAYPHPQDTPGLWHSDEFSSCPSILLAECLTWCWTPPCRHSCWMVPLWKCKC